MIVVEIFALGCEPNIGRFPRGAAASLSEFTRPSRILTAARREPPSNADLHPGNVIMTADGPKIIDWACTLRAPAVFNIGRVHVTLSELVPEDDDPEPPRAINAALQSEYVRLSGISPAKLTAPMQPYLPSFAPSSSSSSGRPPLPSGSG